MPTSPSDLQAPSHTLPVLPAMFLFSGFLDRIVLARQHFQRASGAPRTRCRGGAQWSIREL